MKPPTAIHPHPPVAASVSYRAAWDATPIPQMADRTSQVDHHARPLWTGPQLMARVRATPDHMTVAEAHG